MWLSVIHVGVPQAQASSSLASGSLPARPAGFTRSAPTAAATNSSRNSGDDSFWDQASSSLQVSNTWNQAQFLDVPESMRHAS